MRVTKEFSQELHDANDPRGRVTAKKWLPIWLNRCYRAEDHFHQMEVDLDLIDINGELYAYSEVEVRGKDAWPGHYFERETLHIPARKDKFLGLPYPMVYVAMNWMLSSAFLVRDREIIKWPLRVVPNKFVPDGEEFYDVPVSRLRFEDLRPVA